MRRYREKSTGGGNRSSQKGDRGGDRKQTERRLNGEFTGEDKKMGVVLKGGSEMRGRLERPRK